MNGGDGGEGGGLFLAYHAQKITNRNSGVGFTGNT